MDNPYLTKLRITFAGLLFYWFLPIRKQIVLSNIDIVFKNTATHAEKTRLAKAFYS
ncbi:TPA: lipid A biosynthesis lauroyl acyltransferase, partial [Legionella pneumophila]